MWVNHAVPVYVVIERCLFNRSHIAGQTDGWGKFQICVAGIAHLELKLLQRTARQAQFHSAARVNCGHRGHASDDFIGLNGLTDPNGWIKIRGFGDIPDQRIGGCQLSLGALSGPDEHKGGKG